MGNTAQTTHVHISILRLHAKNAMTSMMAGELLSVKRNVENLKKWSVTQCKL